MREKLIATLERLANAAEPYSADQSGADDDPRLGIVQPITQADGLELNAALLAAWQLLERIRKEKENADIRD